MAKKDLRFIALKKKLLVFLDMAGECVKRVEKFVCFLLLLFFTSHWLMSHFEKEISCQQVSVFIMVLCVNFFFTHQKRCKKNLYFRSTPLHQLHKITVSINTQKIQKEFAWSNLQSGIVTGKRNDGA